MTTTVNLKFYRHLECTVLLNMAHRTNKLNNAILSARHCTCTCTYEKLIVFFVVAAEQIIIKCQSSKEVP